MHTLILAPFTDMYSETSNMLMRIDDEWDNVDVQTIHMNLYDSYWQTLGDYWTGVEDIIVVEQDIVPTLDQLNSLLNCTEIWCAYAYEYMDTTHAGLGLCKFSATLQRLYPDTIRETSKESTDAHPMNHWCNLDDRIRRVLTRYGVSQHIHEGLAVHLSPQPSHGCNLV